MTYERIVENALREECANCIRKGQCEKSHTTKTLVVVQEPEG